MFTPPQSEMESTYRARGKSPIFHDSSDIVTRTGRGSRGGFTRWNEGPGDLFHIQRCSVRGILAPLQHSVFRSPNPVAVSLHAPVPQAPSSLCLPIQWCVSLLNSVLLRLSNRV